ncbi:hypothetical protein NUW54_g5679 [Trametes sanguinea]|uniref:Uncharacterized protein n=1 Tax=Trametes sanguinea TaxID=158606 RepID=A0ACC1PXF1_9APHY|nr:hypothetical protein NUW54_g5679 [Trametes sanguinea]
MDDCDDDSNARDDLQKRHLSSTVAGHPHPLAEPAGGCGHPLLIAHAGFHRHVASMNPRDTTVPAPVQ